MTISPQLGVLLVFLTAASGHLYRKTWKNNGSRLFLWVYGLIAAISILVLGFVPLQFS
ncbi:MAG: hypothetical protein AAF402_04695 [Pseudomonadota bacterium]